MLKKVTILILVFGALNLSAQKLEAGYSEKGTVVIYTGPLLRDSRIEIVRIDSVGKEKTFPLKWPGSPRDIEKNIDIIPDIYKYLLALSPDASEKLWTEFSLASSTEDISMYAVPSVAFACGLAVHDTDVIKRGIWHYRIRINGSFSGDPVSLGKARDNWTSKRARSLGQNNKDLNVRLGWMVPEDARARLLGVVVYRSEPFGQEYEVLRTLRGFQEQGDSLILTVRDTTTHKLGLWHYTVRMIDRYGLPSAVSEIISAHNFPAESTPWFSRFKAQGATDKPEVRLSWKMENSFRARALRIFRGRAFDGPFELISVAGPRDTSYTDRVDDFMEAYFYYLEAEDLAGLDSLKSATHPAVCEYRPEALPVNEISCETQAEKIRISWIGNPPLDRGYYVVRAEGYDTSQMVIVSGFIPADRSKAEYSWTDEDKTLRGDRYYTYGVIAENHGYRKSILTETASARPSIPLFVPTPDRCNIRMNDNGEGALLTWTHVGSKDYANHFGYRLYARKKESTEAYGLLTEKFIMLDTNWYEISTPDPQMEYAVKAVDIFGNESAFSRPARLNEAFLNDFGPRYLRADASDKRRTSLRWVNPANERCKSFELYVTDGTSDPVLSGKFSLDKTSTVVENPPSGKVHYYFIMAFDAQGNASSPSEWIAVLPSAEQAP